MIKKSNFYNNLSELKKANNSENPQQYLTNLKLSFSQLEQDLNNCPLSEILSMDYYKYYNLLYDIFPITSIEENEIKNNDEIDLPKPDQKYIKRICNNPSLSEEEKTNILKNTLNLSEESIKTYVEKLNVGISTSQFAKAKLHKLTTKKRYIISSAQTASPVNRQFLENIKTYAEYIDAEIGIIATRYRNPTSIWKEEGDVWDVLTHPYLTAQRQFLHKNLLLLADLKIQATAPNPTNGIESFGDHASVIVGSPRIEMRSVPVLDGQVQKFLWSTGSVTIPSFTDTVAGGKAAEHHSYGFLVVEIENDDIVHVRNVSAHEDGSFNDLFYRIEDQKVMTEPTDCLVWGDSHFAQKDEKVTKVFRRLCSHLGVNTSILHDVWDSESINVHNVKNPIVQYQLQKEGKDDLKKELAQMDKELKWFDSNMERTIVVASNHDDMLDRAMYQGDWRDNLKNAEIFIDMLKVTLSGQAPKGIIPYHISKHFKNIIPLGVDDSYILNGVELALHGHIGPNGSKGNILSFSKLSEKSIIGHSHSPAIKNGCYQVGISCAMKHGYNKGLSGWAYAGVTLNKYGKRQMIIFNKNSLTYTTLI